MTDICYVPIVKAKRNDLAALGDLRAANKKCVRPLIELAGHLIYDVDAEISDFAVRFSTINWPNRPYADLYAFMPDATNSLGENATIAGFRNLARTGAEFIPTYGRQRNEKVWHELASIVEIAGGEFCFRVDVDDLDDQSEETWIDIVERSAQMGLRPSKLDILLDLRSVGSRDTKTLLDRVLDFLALRPAKFEPRQIVVAGSSALSDVAEVPRNGMGIVSRKELHVWAQITNELAGTTTLAFGDYGVVHPNFMQDGPRPNANAKIRYSAGANTYYFRGTCLRYPPKYDQYHDLARKVVASSLYHGPDFSEGDDRVWKCARHEVGPGNLSTWVRADQNHHFELMPHQILSLQQQVVREKPNKVAALVESV